MVDRSYGCFSREGERDCGEEADRVTVPQPSQRLTMRQELKGQEAVAVEEGQCSMAIGTVRERMTRKGAQEAAGSTGTTCSVGKQGRQAEGGGTYCTGQVDSKSWGK